MGSVAVFTVMFFPPFGSERSGGVVQCVRSVLHPDSYRGAALCLRMYFTQTSCLVPRGRELGDGFRRFGLCVWMLFFFSTMLPPAAPAKCSLWLRWENREALPPAALQTSLG